MQDIADPGDRCIPAITVNGTDAAPVSPDPGNGADVAIGAAVRGPGLAGPLPAAADQHPAARGGRPADRRPVEPGAGGQHAYPPTGLVAPTGYAVQVSPGTARLRATASDGSIRLVTPRVVAGRRYAAFVIGTSLRLKRLTWLDAAGKAFASTTSLPQSGYTQFQP